MTDCVIRAENLGKKYRIQHQNDTYLVSLRDVFANTLAAPFNWKTKKKRSPSVEDFWALKDLSFEIQRGEVVGIIGRNGAGKSTLLKILSRITKPSQGRVCIRGQVASLLEVGTGFHPELTGRENILLNGAILGMTRADIARRFDEIVAFAEIDKFLDTPVKRYSSGMYVRLAFAVAAHLNPEILVVDEVLAVGDAEFQKKCLGKMQSVATEQGRTVLFVSHQIAAIQRLCRRVFLLRDGRIANVGQPDEVISYYLSADNIESGTVDLRQLPRNRRFGNGLVRFTGIDLLSLNGKTLRDVRMREPIIVRLHLHAKQAFTDITVAIRFVAADGVEVHGSTTQGTGLPSGVETGDYTFECRIEPQILTPGRYYIRLAAFRYAEDFDHVYEALAFDVSAATYSIEETAGDHYAGYVYLPYQWTRQRDG